MDKEELRIEIISAIGRVANRVENERKCNDLSGIFISENEIIANLGLDSLEMIALAEALEKKFHIGYMEAKVIQNMTVGELCDEIIRHVEKLELK